MFNSPKNKEIMGKQNEVGTLAINMIVSGTTIKGDIKTADDFRINGTLHGIIESNGKVVLGSAGVVEGEMDCQNAVIEGKFKGKIRVKDLLSMSATARVEGEISTGSLSIEPGAVFVGTCTMGSQGIRQMKPDVERTEEKTAIL